MAPSGSGHAGARGAMASSENRSVAELKRDVLALVRATSEASRASSRGPEARVDACYARFQSACRAWLETCALAPPPQHNSEKSDSATALQREATLMQTRLRAAAGLVARHCSAQERQTLVTAVVRSIVAMQTITQRRRKRKLSSASADALVDRVASAHTEDLQSSIAEFIAVWSLHALGLLRLEDVLVEAVSSGQGSSAYDWVTAPACLLLSRPAIVIPLLGTLETAATTTRDLVEHVLSYVIRLAFADSADSISLLNDTNRRSQSGAIKRKAATRVLESLICFSSATFSIPALCILTQLATAKSAAVKAKETDRSPRNAASSHRDHGGAGSFGQDAIISRDRVIAFLQPQLAAFVAPSSTAHSICTPDEITRIFSAYEACLPASAFVQIVRQFIYEANGESTKRSAADSKSIIRGALYQLNRHLASTQTEFVAQLLTAAHEMAHEGVQGINGSLLQHALELVAAVSEAPVRRQATTALTNAAVDCYRDWFHGHFAADDSSQDRKTSDSGGQDVQQAVRRCQRPRQTCKLVTSKRQIQFLCAFLLEFDRRADEPNEVKGSFPGAKSDHVAAHLSAMKTHQPQFPSGGLIMDFCSQTRSRYLELLKQEQTAAQVSTDSGTSNAGLGGSGAKPKQLAPRSHSMKVRDMVRENIHIYEDTKKVSPQLRQWRMFQPQLWKQEFVPCCLDIEYDGLEESDDAAGASGVANESAPLETKVLAHASFVHTLASTGVISPQEYAQFLSRIEAWVLARQARFYTRRGYKRQRQEIGKGLSHAVQSLQREVHASDEGALLLPRKKVPRAQMEVLTSAFEAALSSLADNVAGLANQPNTAIPSASLMRSLWEDGCLKVVEVLGLHQLDAFFAYLVPLLLRSPSPQDLRSKQLQSERQSEADALESFTQFSISQVSWTSSLQDETLLHEMSCLCAVLAALLARSGAVSKCDRANPARFLQQIDDALFAGSGGSDVVQSDSSEEHVLKRSLFYTSILRALAAVSVDTQASAVLVLLHSESLHAGARDFVSWLVFRSIGASNPSRGQFSLLADNFCAISQMRWRNQVLDPMKSVKDRVKTLFALEFRHGLQVFGESAARSQVISNVAGRTEWVQAQLDATEDIVQRRIVSVEDVIEWVIDAVVSECSVESEEKGELLEADNAIVQMLLLLSDLMHKVSAQSLTNDLGSRNLSSTAHDRILAYFARSVQQARDRRRYGNRQLRHHGFEVLEICARHGRHAMSSQTANGVLELINCIGENYFHDQILPWSLLRTMLVLLTQVLVGAASSNLQSAVDILRNCSVAIISRFGLELRRVEALVQAADNRANIQLTSLLEWVHRFCNEVLDQGRAGFAHASHSVADIFPTEADALKYRVCLIKLLFRWKRIAAPEPTTQAHELSAFHHEIAERILRVCRLDSSAADPKNDTDARERMQATGEGSLVLVGSCFAEEWERALAASTTQEQKEDYQLDFQFQLCCLHVVASACQQSALFSKKLLRSWRESTSSSSSSSNGSARAILLALVAIILSDSRQLESVCGSSSSIWVDEFPQIALHVYSMKTEALNASGAAEDESSSLIRWVQVIAHTRSFDERLTDAVRVVLQYGITHRVDIMDTVLASRILCAWPSLSTMVP